MEIHIVKLVHALVKKARDVKWSSGKRILQLSLELEHLQGIILYERECVEHWIDPLEFEAHKQIGRKIMLGLCLFKDSWIKNSMRFNRSWKRFKRRRRKQGRL